MNGNEIKGPFTHALTQFSLILESESPRPDAGSVSTGAVTGRRPKQNTSELHFIHFLMKISCFSQQHRRQILLTESETSSTTLRRLKTSLMFLVEAAYEPLLHSN